MPTESLSILGATGSIGSQALTVAERNGIKVTGLTANGSVDALAKAAIKFGVDRVAIADETKVPQLKSMLFGTGTEVFGGNEGICRIASDERADTVLNSIVGIAGLMPTLAAISHTSRIALANKETLVTAGRLVNERLSASDTELIPVDSEHSAIFQCLRGSSHGELKKIILTASGGPFFGKSREEIENVTPAEALKHPNWSMGSKITIDSATLMNKGLEVIEAVHLFGVSAKDIEVVVHRQSILHSAVEFCDGAVIAQLGVPDMKLPIQYALTYPCRMPSFDEQLDLIKVSSLTFERPDTDTFECLGVCIDAIEKGGLVPAAANGANEAAVSLFLDGKIGFTDIGKLVRGAAERQSVFEDYDVDDVFAADRAAREYVMSAVGCGGV